MSSSGSTQHPSGDHPFKGPHGDSEFYNHQPIVFYPNLLSQHEQHQHQHEQHQQQIYSTNPNPPPTMDYDLVNMNTGGAYLTYAFFPTFPNPSLQQSSNGTTTTVSSCRSRYEQPLGDLIPPPSLVDMNYKKFLRPGRFSLQKPMPHNAKTKKRQLSNRYVCIFWVDISPNDHFVVVKRILGKNGNNTRKVALACDAKIRLRGKGSGFLEGPEERESEEQLQLHVSCVDFKKYERAIFMVNCLLEDIYTHYKRFCEKGGNGGGCGVNGGEKLNVRMEEVRRDDLDFNYLPRMATSSGTGPGTGGAAKRKLLEVEETKSPSKPSETFQ